MKNLKKILNYAMATGLTAALSAPASLWGTFAQFQNHLLKPATHAPLEKINNAVLLEQLNIELLENVLQDAAKVYVHGGHNVVVGAIYAASPALLNGIYKELRTPGFKWTLADALQRDAAGATQLIYDHFSPKIDAIVAAAAGGTAAAIALANTAAELAAGGGAPNPPVLTTTYTGITLTADNDNQKLAAVLALQIVQTFAPEDEATMITDLAPTLQAEYLEHLPRLKLGAGVAWGLAYAKPGGLPAAWGPGGAENYSQVVWDMVSYASIRKHGLSQKVACTADGAQLGELGAAVDVGAANSGENGKGFGKLRTGLIANDYTGLFTAATAHSLLNAANPETHVDPYISLINSFAQVNTPVVLQSDGVTNTTAADLFHNGYGTFASLLKARTLGYYPITDYAGKVMAELTASFGPYARGKFWTASAPVVGLIKAAVATVCNNITADTMGGGAAQPISTYLGADYIKPADITGPAALTAAGLQTVVATAIGKKLFDETLAAPSAYTPHAGVATDYTDPKLLFKAIVKDVYDNYGEIGYGFADAPTVRTAAKQLFASAGAAPAVLAQKQNFILSSLITDKIIKFSHVADAFRQSWSNNQLRDALIAKINTFVNAVDAGGNSIPGMPDGTGIEKDAKVAAGFTWLQTLGATDDRLTAAATSGVNVNGTVTKAVFQELMSDATAFGVVATPGDPAATHDGIDHTTLLPVVQAMMMVYYGRVPADQNAIRDAAVAALSGEYTRVAALVGAGRATATNLEAAVEAGTGIGVAAMHLNGAAGVDALTALAALNVAGAPGAYILRRVGGGHLTALATGAANIAVGATGATADQVVVQDAIKDYFGLDAAPAVNAKVKAICQHYVTDVQMKDAICLKLNDAAAGHLHTFNDAGGIWQNIQGNANPLWVRANISNFTGAAAAHDPLLRPYTAYSTLTHTLDLAADGDTSIGAVKAAIGTRIDAAIDAGTRTAADTLANLVTNPAVADSQAKVFNDTADAAIAANSATYLADYLALAANAWAAPWVNMTHLMTQAIDANMMHTYDHYLGKSDNSWELSSATWPNYWLTDKPMLVGDILNADGTLKPAGQSFSMRWYAPGAGVAAQVTDLRALANSVYGVGFPNNAVVIARGAFPAGVAGLGQHAENAYVQAYGLNLGIMDLYSTASSLVFGTEAAWLDPAALTHACNWASVTAPGDNLRNGRKWVFGSIAQYLNAAYGLDNDVLVALAGDAAHGNEFRNSAVYNAAVPASGVHSPRGTDVQHKGAVLANLVALAPSMHVAVGTDIPGIGAGNKFPQLREEVRAYREMMETYRALQEFYAYSQTQAVEAVKNRAKWAMLCARRVHDLVLVGALANVDAAGNIAGRNGCNKVMTEIATTMGLEKAVDGTWGYAALLAGSKPVGSMTDCTAKIGVIFTAVATISPGGAGAGQLTRGMLVNEDPLAPQDFKRLLAAVGDMAITPKANPVPASSGAASSSTSSEQKLVTTSPYVSKGQLSNDVYRDVNVAAAVKPEMMSAVPLVQVSKMANQYVAQALKKGASNEVKVAAANASFAVAERTGTTNVIVMSTLSKPAQAEVRKLDTQIKVLDTQIRTGGVTQAAKKALATKRDLIAKKVVILRKAYQSSYGRMKVSAPRAPAKRGVAPKAAPAKGSVAPKPAPAKASAPKAAPKTAKAA